jgi:hypothetical protein
MKRNVQPNRLSVGYQHPNARSNNMAKVQYSSVLRNRNNIVDYSIQTPNNPIMEGGGIMDIARNIYEKGKTLGNLYTGEIGTAIRNAIPDSDDTARTGFVGEKHAILVLKNGKNGVANYMGPDTKIVERLKRGDPPRTEVDEISKAHDIRYALAKNNKDIRKADDIFSKAVRNTEKRGTDNPRNILLSKAITAKKYAEDIGFLSKDAFSGNLKGKVVSDADRIVLMSNLGGLAQKGYGLPRGGLPVKSRLPIGSAVVLPGDKLRNKVLKQLMRNKNTQGSNIMTIPTGSGAAMSTLPTHVPMSKTFENTKNYKMIKGVGAPDVLSMITKNLVPFLMENVGIKKDLIPVDSITKIIKQGLANSKNGNASSVISNLSKSILTILTASKMRSMGVQTNGTQSKLLDVLGTSKNDLLKGLSGILKNTFGLMTGSPLSGSGKGSPLRGKGKSLRGKRKGKSLRGKGFWSKFASDFTGVFKPFATVAGPIFDAVGLPELGIPLSALGSIL